MRKLFHTNVLWKAIIVFAACSVVNNFLTLYEQSSQTSKVIYYDQDAVPAVKNVSQSDPNLSSNFGSKNTNVPFPRFTILPRHSCGDDDVTMVIIVFSHVNNFMSRIFIRKTWGSYARDKSNNASLIFLVALSNESSNDHIQRQHLGREAKSSNDHIQRYMGRETKSSNDHIQRQHLGREAKSSNDHIQRHMGRETKSSNDHIQRHLEREAKSSNDYIQRHQEREAKFSNDYIQRHLEREAEIHGDILQVHFPEHYRNLSLKSIAMLNWVAERCQNIEYVLKADDDVYVQVPLLVRAMAQMSARSFRRVNFVFGGVGSRKRHFNKRSKWYTSKEEYKGYFYPPFVSGTAYAMTRRTAMRLYAATHRVARFWLEDVYVTGMCAQNARVKVVVNILFSLGRVPIRDCDVKTYYSIHGYGYERFPEIHRMIYKYCIFQ